MALPNIYKSHKKTELISSKFYAILSLIILLCLVIYKYAFKNGKLICTDYIFNSYLYFILSNIIIFSVVIIHEHTKFYNPIIRAYESKYIIIPISYMIIQLFIIYQLKKNIKNFEHSDIVKLHILWLFMLILIGLFLIPIMHFFRIHHVANYFIIIALIASTTIIINNLVYNNQIKFEKSLILMLFLFISSCIILPILGYNLSGNNIDYMPTVATILKTLLLIIIILVIVVNHNEIIKKAEICSLTKLENYPNYPEDTLDLFILLKNTVSIFLDYIGVCSYA